MTKKTGRVLCAVASFILLTAILPASAAAAAISGTARVIDGDSLILAGVEIRLAGMDAFEWDQTCGVFACGKTATAMLKDLITKRTVVCGIRGRSYDRMVAVCHADGSDLGAALVEAGVAINSDRYTPDYSDAEAVAKKARNGAWAHEFMAPWEWRRR